MIINWRGFNWLVRGTQVQESPGNNYFSPDNVSLDIDDNLQMSMNNNKCSEIILNEGDLPFGLYKFKINTGFFNKNAVLGIFLYEDDKHEVDIEFSKWGKFFNKNAQFVNQSDAKNPTRFWSFRTSIKISIEYRKEFITLKYFNKSVTYKNNLTLPRLHINLWTNAEPRPTYIKLIDFKFST